MIPFHAASSFPIKTKPRDPETLIRLLFGIAHPAGFAFFFNTEPAKHGIRLPSNAEYCHFS